EGDREVREPEDPARVHEHVTVADVEGGVGGGRGEGGGGRAAGGAGERGCGLGRSGAVDEGGNARVCGARDREAGLGGAQLGDREKLIRSARAAVPGVLRDREQRAAALLCEQ